MRKSRTLVAAAAVALAATGGIAGPSHAADQPQVRTLAKGMFSPLSAAVAPNGTAYVTQNFIGQLMKVRPGKSPRSVYASEGGNEVGAVSERDGVVMFAESAADENGNYVDTWLKKIGRDGKVRTVASLMTHEKKTNPDGGVVYGARGISEDCAAQWPTDQAGPPTYTGILDSHPYATFQGAKRTFVADAAANAVFAVTRKGAVRTVAVLPAIPTEITAEFAQSMGLPECAVGLKYFFEAVPTDVERGPDGKLYVTSLPGGPEDPSLGARGSIFRVDPARHKARKVVAGLGSPVGVAVADNGDLYASQLFTGSIVRVNHRTGKKRTFASVPMPGDVEISTGSVYATINVLTGLSGEPGNDPNGKLVKFRS